MSMAEKQEQSRLQIYELAMPGVYLLEPEKHGDDRGFFSETYNKCVFESFGLGTGFVQDNHSLSAQKGTVRGLHFQTPPDAQAKLVRVLRGAIQDVCVDIRRGSPTFGQHIAVTLTAKNWKQLWVPEGIAHGFCTLEPDTEVLYKVSRYYAPAHDKGLAWDDPDLGISWSLDEGATPVLSDKDRNYPCLSALPAYFDTAKA